MWFTPLLGGGQQQLPEVPGILRIPNTLTSQPQTAPQIDWGNPITNKLLAWHVGPHVKEFTLVNNPTVVPTIKGLANNFQKASSQYIYKPIKRIGKPITLVVLCKFTTDNDSSIFSLGDSTANYGMNIIKYSTFALMQRPNPTGGQELYIYNLDTNWHVFTFAWDENSNLIGYVDGISVGIKNDPAYSTATYDTFVVGADYRNNTASNFSGGQVALALTYTRVLSGAEVRSISQNPWQVFQAPQKKIFTFPGIDVTTRPIADVSLPNNKIFRRPVTLAQQPQTPPQIDWGNPLTKGLLDWQAGNFLNGFTPVNTPGTSYSYKGVSKTFINSSSRYLTKTLKSSVGENLSIVSVARTNSFYALKALGGFASTAQRDYLQLLAPYIANPFQLERYQPYSGQSSGGATQDTNWHVHIGVADSNLRYYIDGKGGVAGETALIPANLYNTLVIGGIYNGALPAYSNFFDGEIALTLFYTRALTEKEAAALSQNPWQVFKNPHSKHISIPDIASPYERYTPLFFAPSRKKFPSDATPLNLGHPILRGLEQGIIAGPVRNATTRNQYTVRTSIPGAAPFGVGEQLSGSTGYISAPTVADSSTAPWTYIVYGVVPSIGINCSLLVTANNFAGSSVFDRSISLSTTGAVQARIYNPSPYAYDQITTTTKTVTPGVPFIAAAVATGSELIAYLDYNKVSVGAPTTGFIYNNPFFVVGYGGAGVTQNSSSNATIAYALKLNRAITDAEWNSLVQDPWQIFMPGVKRVLALPTFVSPWTSNISNESLYDDVDDTSTNDGDYIISSPATSGVVGDPVIFKLSKTLPQGTHTVRARAKKSATLGEVRAALLDSNNLPVGTSAWQPLSNTFRTYELAITTTGSASRVKFETIGSSFSNAIVLNGLILHLDAGNTLSYSGSGTTWTDLSGNGNNGTLTNGPTYSSANGGTIVFDGVNDYVMLGTPSTLVGLQVPLTICAWVYPNSLSQLSTIYGVYGGTSGGRLYSMVRVDSGILKYYTSTAVGNFQSIGTLTITTSTWQFIAVRVSGSISSPIVTLFRNDISETGGLSALSTSPDLTVTFRIAGNQAVSNESLNGRIPFLTVYNRALSQAEIQQNFNATRGRFGV